MAGKTLTQAISISGKLDPSLQASISKAEKMASGMGGRMKKAAGVAAGALAGVAAAGTAAAAASGKYLLDLGTKFDESADAIRIGTGATGEALAALQADCDAVYQAIPGDLEGASTAIADYNTRLGLSGEPLQRLSQQALEVCDMLGEDLPTVIEHSSQAFQQWNVPAERMSEEMDYLFKVSQSTGIGFDDLSARMQKYGPQLQELGMDFDHAAALMGQMEKAGVNTDEALGALKKSVGTMAKQGLSASEGMAKYVKQIKSAESAEKAAAVASEIFGSRAGSTMAAAIRDGALSVEDLTAELRANGETISGAAEDTYDFAERLEIFRHKAEVALKPLANTVFDSLNDLMPMAESAMEALVPMLEQAGAQAGPVVEQLAATVADSFAQMAPVVLDFAAQAGPMLANLAATLIPQLMDAISQMLPIAMQVIEAVLPVATDLISALMPVMSSVIGVVGSLMKALTPLLNPLMQLVRTLLPPISGLITTVLSAMQPVIGVVEGIAGAVGSLCGWLTDLVNAAQRAGDALGKAMSGDFGGAAKALGFATGGFTKGVSIAGEDPNYPVEAVLSFNPAYRAQNIRYWQMAGAMLGATKGAAHAAPTAANAVTADAGKQLASGADPWPEPKGGGAYYDFSGISFNPTIVVEGGDRQDVLAALREARDEFGDFMLELAEEMEEGSYRA